MKTQYGNPVRPYALATEFVGSAMTGTVQPSRASQASGGSFGALGSLEVATERRSTPDGTPPALTHASTSGTSRWQCGHQWAMNMIALARPSWAIRTDSPAKSVPAISGAVSPTAGSSVGFWKSGSWAPLISGTPDAATGALAPAVAGGTLELPPVGALEPGRTKAMTAASRTAPTSATGRSHGDRAVDPARMLPPRAAARRS